MLSRAATSRGAPWRDVVRHDSVPQAKTMEYGSFVNTRWGLRGIRRKPRVKTGSHTNLLPPFAPPLLCSLRSAATFSGSSQPTARDPWPLFFVPRSLWEWGGVWEVGATGGGAGGSCGGIAGGTAGGTRVRVAGGPERSPRIWWQLLRTLGDRANKKECEELLVTRACLYNHRIRTSSYATPSCRRLPGTLGDRLESKSVFAEAGDAGATDSASPSAPVPLAKAFLLAPWKAISQSTCTSSQPAVMCEYVVCIVACSVVAQSLLWYPHRCTKYVLTQQALAYTT